MNRVGVRITRLSGTEDLPLPSYKSDGAAGMDIFAACDAPVTILPGARAVVSTGFRIAVPVGYEAQVRPRSGLARDFGVDIANSPGTIDADYRGEVQIILSNHGTEPFVVERGDRVAQLIVAPVSHVEWEVVSTLDETVRGDGGFGHTGRRH
ncbi:MAG: dUTP diphosphatase [Akkermansiaceae bacterium]|nr:dUTP diphosphatase [Armatimonadota bacterium]